MLSPPLPPPYGEDDRWPAAVAMWRGGELVTCDPDGGVPDWSQDAPIASLSGNNHTVYYKLPTRWARRSVEGGTEVGVGTFRDVLALVDPNGQGQSTIARWAPLLSLAVPLLHAPESAFGTWLPRPLSRLVTCSRKPAKQRAGPPGHISA